MSAFRPGKWTLVSKDPAASSRRTSAHQSSSARLGHELFEWFERELVVVLTEAQRTPEWFLLRQFRITASVAAALWRALAREQQQQLHDVGDSGDLPAPSADVAELIISRNVERVFELLGIRMQHAYPVGPPRFPSSSASAARKSNTTSSNNAAPRPAEGVDDGGAEMIWSEDTLKRLKKAELVEMCKARGVPSSGNKPVLIERILEVQIIDPNVSSASSAQRTMPAILLGKWFMTPVKTTNMKLGV